MTSVATRKRLRDKRADLNLCVTCGTGNRIPGKTECESCNGTTAKRRRDRYAKLRAEGRCGTCGAPSLKSLCPRCLRQCIDGTRARKRRYKASGRCADCGAENSSRAGKTRCGACARKYDEAKRAKGFGITVEQLRAVLAPGKCAICGSTEDLHVDHCHATGTVRGILCERHNLALGQFDDNPDHLMRAAEYLCSPPVDLGTGSDMRESCPSAHSDPVRPLAAAT